MENDNSELYAEVHHLRLMLKLEKQKTRQLLEQLKAKIDELKDEVDNQDTTVWE